jgi:hypothetical protein
MHSPKRRPQRISFSVEQMEEESMTEPGYSSVKMDRFVTRAEAFLIPKIEEKDEVDTYASRVESETQVPPKQPIEMPRNICHPPVISVKEFAPLNRLQLETLDNGGKLLAETLKGDKH